MIAKREPLTFTPTAFDTADDKMRFYRHFIKFVERGFPETLFHKWFYNRLSMCFGHIAHYNQGGFYETWFSDNRKQYDFLFHALTWFSNGKPEYMYCDVEIALKQWIESPAGLKVMVGLRSTIETDTEKRERAELARLKAKYEEANG